MVLLLPLLASFLFGFYLFYILYSIYPYSILPVPRSQRRVYLEWMHALRCQWHNEEIIQFLYQLSCKYRHLSIYISIPLLFLYYYCRLLRSWRRALFWSPIRKVKWRSGWNLFKLRSIHWPQPSDWWNAPAANILFRRSKLQIFSIKANNFITFLCIILYLMIFFTLL